MRCDLSILSSGYLFSTLLIPKLLLYRFSGRGAASEGVGNWKRGKAFSSAVKSILNVDNSLLLAARRAGITIPGLSGWPCTKNVKTTEGGIMDFTLMIQEERHN